MGGDLAKVNTTRQSWMGKSLNANQYNNKTISHEEGSCFEYKFERNCFKPFIFTGNDRVKIGLLSVLM